MRESRKGIRTTVTTLVGLALAGVVGGAAPAHGQAQTTTSNRRVDFQPNTAVVTREGTFFINGRVHVLLHATRDAAGGCHVTGHANPQGLSVSGPGMGGPTYRAAGAANFTFQSTSGQSGDRLHGVLNLNLIGKGRAPDIKLHMRMRTEPAMAPGTCNAADIARLILTELGVTVPPGTLPPGTP
jgi:hypothetical protein